MRSPTKRHGGLLAGAVVLALALVAVGCTGDDDDARTTTTLAGAVTTTTAPERVSDGRLKIGIFLPRTGPGADLGEPMIAAVEDAIATINASGGVLGEPVDSAILDEGAGTGPSALLAENVDAIVGPASSNVALSQLSSIVQPGNGVVTCSPTATALLLDDYPDNGYFFRTAPSDSLQMVALARLAREEGVTSVAVGYLDDPYGRGLVDAFSDEARSRGITIVAEEGFSSDQDDLSETAAAMLEQQPGVVVVLGDADDGARLLAALDADPASSSVRRFIVNDAIRTARSTIQALSPLFRTRLTGVAPLAVSPRTNGPPGFFTSHAIDCVNLIALAAMTAQSDDPDDIQVRMAPVGSGGAECRSFESCGAFIADLLDIDYDGASGDVELSNSAGDPVSGWFEEFEFSEDGLETNSRQFEVRG